MYIQMFCEDLYIKVKALTPEFLSESADETTLKMIFSVNNTICKHGH